jgi:hypothetical protein
MKRMKRSFLAVGLILSALCVQADVVSSGALNEVIPDGSSVGVVSTIDLSGEVLGPTESLEVALHISDVSGDLDYANAGDFYAYLTSGNGGFAVLLNRVGKTTLSPFGSALNGFDVTFSLTGDDIHLVDDGTAVLDAEGRLTGTWGADGRDIDPDLVLDTDLQTAGLGSFVGLDPNTEWSIFIADLSMGGVAQLDSWSIDVIPETGTLGLISFVGIGVLFIRRRLMM